MDKHQIGVNAGKVWKLLNDNKRWSYCDLKRASELSDRDLNAAIGWLARENKMWGQNFFNYLFSFFNQLF